MKEMFQDYKTMVAEPKKEFNELYRKEVILLNVAFEFRMVYQKRKYTTCFY